MTDRLRALMKANPRFAEALADGERWAVQRAEMVKGIDGQSSRHFPERALEEDGITRRNWCGSCASKLGCVMCDLPNNHAVAKRVGGIFDD